MWRVLLYGQTVRHLRIGQIFHRLRFRFIRPGVDTRPPPPLRPRLGSWTPSAERVASMTGPQSFSFLGQEGTVVDGWNPSNQSRLWRYNLHYFDDLTATDAAERRAWHTALIAFWIRDNPPARGTGWEPYPTARRIVNWIKAEQAGLPLGPDAVTSLAMQARWLKTRVEHHLSGNHLLANAIALCFAGLRFQGDEAEDWYATGSAILLRELPQQILPDGGHYERSPMYHSLVLVDLLDLLNLRRCLASTADPPTALAASTIEPMLAWLRGMTHPDGDISFFNDTALEVAAQPSALMAYAERLGFTPPPPPPVGLSGFAASGYWRLQTHRAVLLADVAELGPDHQPGHAHADTLSFELSLGGERVLVNSGTSDYATGLERQRQRGTAAHNTVVLDDRDSSEVWAAFRVARRARPRLHLASAGEHQMRLVADHDGYARLRGKPIHKREWVLDTNSLQVTDELSGPPRLAIARFHFAPEITLLHHRQTGSATGAVREILQWTCDAGTAWVEAATYHPRFGESMPTQCLCVRLEGNRSSLKFIFASAS
ncbi:heparinase II/III family protein [Tianweitania sediminis]|nr:heparinase II/III family protein [Tianweitania sediminis]